MAFSAQKLRRGAKQLVMRQAIRTTARLPIAHQRRIMSSLFTLAGGLPMLRRRVRDNMRLALGAEVPAHAASLYFRRVGWFMSTSLEIFHHGLDATPVADEVKFDDSVRLLDEAVAEGRGVVVTTPHWSGYEIIGGVLNRRHPTAIMGRQSSTPEHMARKLKWYDALGVEALLRPSGVSSMKDAVSFLSVLKRGKALVITPDLLAESGQGVEARVFGRPARLQGGAFAIANTARAPLLRLTCKWQSDRSAVITWERAPAMVRGGDRDTAVRNAAQDWCRWFEARLAASPENWLFWLDKRWSRLLRATPRVSGAE